MSRTISQQLLLDQLEEQVERQLSTAVTDYQNSSRERLLQKPASGGWSAAECLWHLNSYGNYYLPEIEAGLSSGSPSTGTFTSTWLGAWFTRMMQPGAKTKKMKAFKGHTPPPELDPLPVVAEFIQQQERLLLLLRKARAVNMNRIRIGISIMPWFKMKLGDVFQLLIVHQERHLQQAARVANEHRE